MKNALLFALVLTAMMVLSCAMPGDAGFKFDSPRFNSMEEACQWVNKNISYNRDAYDKWKLPEETIDDRRGDCEDMAILLMAIMNYQKGYKSDLIVVQIDNNTYHAIARNGNDYYDCTNGKTVRSPRYKVTNVYDFDTTLYMARYIKRY